METRKYIGSGYLDKTASGELTFVGVLNRYFDENGGFDPISAPWAENTKRQYINDYENRLIPNLNNRIALSQYTEDDFIETLLRIQRQYGYNREQMLHYRHLLWVVYRAGIQNHLYEDNLEWESAKLTGESDEELNAEDMKLRELTLKRSFSKSEAITLLNYFIRLDPVKATGEQIGLYLMFLYGLRNNEAAALDFDAVKRVGSRKIPCIYIRQSALQDRREKKGSGKTRNANRIVPIFDSTYEFLMKRKSFVTKKAENGEFVLPNGNLNISHFPIVCNEMNFEKMALPRELSKAGRNLFRKLRIGAHAIDLAHQTLFLQRLNEVDIGEKDPTTYLMRRNFATRLYGLGLSSGQIEYLIGHDLESADESRNDYANEDMLYELKKFIDLHPYNLYISGNPESEVIFMAYKPYSNDMNAEEHLRLQTGGAVSRFYVRVNAQEPLDDITVSIKNEAKVKCRAIKSTHIGADSVKPIVNIRKFNKL